MASAGASAATTAAIAAAAAPRARRLPIGGLLVEVEPEAFVPVAREASAEGRLVFTGQIGSFRKRRIYVTTAGGATFYCKTDVSDQLPVSALEVAKVDTDSLSL